MMINLLKKVALVHPKPNLSRLLLTALVAAMVGGCSPDAPQSNTYDNKETQGGWQQTDLKTTIIELKNTLQANPEDRMARWELGKLYLQQGQGAAAEKELRHAAQLGAAPQLIAVPLARSLLLQGKYQDLLLEAAPSLVINNKNKVEILLLRGQAFGGLGNTRESEQAWLDALKLDPAHVPTLLKLAELTLDQQDFAQFQRYLTNASQIAPENQTVWMLRGKRKTLQQDYIGAAQDYRHAIERAPEGDYAAQLALAWSLVYQGKNQDAANIIDKLDPVARKQPTTQFAEAAIAYQSGYQQQAYDLLTTLNNAMPDNIRAKLMLAGSSFALNKLEQAHVLTSQVLKQAPNLPYAVNLMAAIYRKQGKPEKAVKLIQQNLVQGKADTVMLGSLSAAFIESGDYDAASNTLNALTTDTTGTIASTAGEAAAALEQHRPKKALDILQQPVQGTPILDIPTTRRLYRLLAEEKFDTVLGEAQQFHEAQPDAPLPLVFIGLAQLSLNDPDAARRALQQALGLNPGDPTAAQVLARMATRDGDPEEAESLYREVLQYHPGDVPTLMMLSDLQARQKRMDDAIATLQIAIGQQPFNLDANLTLARFQLSNNQATEALTTLDGITAVHADKAGYLQVRGEVLMALNRLDEALKFFDALSAKYPKSNEGHYLAAKAYALQGDRQQMLAHLNEAHRLNPSDFNAKVTQTLQLISEKQFDQAAALAEQLVTEQPFNSQTWYLRGATALGQGQTSIAVNAFGYAMRICPRTEYVLSLTQALWQDGQHQPALRALETWVKQYPDDSAAHSALADTYLLMNHRDHARRQYERVIELKPDYVPALNNLAFILATVDLDQAISYAQRGYRLLPNSPVVVDSLADLLLKKGDTDQALKILAKARQQAPEDPNLAYRQAQALALTGNSARARELLQQALGYKGKFASRSEAESLLKKLKETRAANPSP